MVSQLASLKGYVFMSLFDFFVFVLVSCRSEEKGVISMLERNVELKHAPERWQEIKDPHQYDVIICFESRVFEHLNEGEKISISFCTSRVFSI